MKIVSPTKLDPTRSITLRRGFARSLTVVFTELRKQINNLLIVEDAFGLKKDTTIQWTTNKGYEYASTQVNLKPDDAAKVIGLQSTLLLSEDIVKLEDEPHITVRYGLFDQPGMLDAVKTMVSGYGPIVAKILGLSTFDMDDRDVLKFDIESQHLRELNARLKLLPNYESFDYNPHITVAYVSGGEGSKYIRKTELDGKTLVFDTIMFSDSNGDKTPIRLGDITYNRRWKYSTQSEAVEEFDKWLKDKVKHTVLSETQSNKWRKFINRGFEKGANRAFDDTSTVRKQSGLDNLRGLGFVEGKREQFIRTTLSRAVAIEKVKLLQSNALASLEGVCNDMVTKSRRILSEGLVNNLSPRDIASKLSKQLNISQGRAETIAFTELVRAHAEGQLEAMEQLGMSTVGIAVEWSTVQNPCKMCQPMKGVVLKITEARGLIPRHPRCLCAFVPANVGEDKQEKKLQKRSKTKIDKAIKQSERQGSTNDDWGPNKAISKERPTSTLNIECDCTNYIVYEKLIQNIFCPTGIGGGIDPHCKAGSNGGTSHQHLQEQELNRLHTEHPILKTIPHATVKLHEGEYITTPDGIGLADVHSKLYGAYSHGKNHIDLAKEGHDFEGRFRHEYGHHVQDHLKVIDPNTGRRLSWINIYERHKNDKAFNDYHRLTHKEMFADSFMRFTSPNYKKGELPKEIERFFEIALGKK